MSSPETDDDTLKSFYLASGMIVVDWAQVEQMLDVIVNLIYIDLGGKTVAKQQRIPRMLKEKIKFLKRCFAELTDLEQCRKEGETLLNNFNNLSERRHGLIHGALSDFDLTDGRFTFTKMDDEEDYHTFRRFNFDAEMFEKLIKELGNLQYAAGRVANRLAQVIESRDSLTP